MEVAVAEEKRKIFRARKTMKISDRQQLETLHNTLLTGNPPISNPSPPPLVNGTHKEDGRKTVDKEQNEAMDSNSSHAPSPVSLASQGSPIPSLSLNLSPSPSASQSPKANEENPSTSPFHSLNFDLKKMEEGKKESLSSPSNDGPVSVSTEPKEGQDKGKEQTTGKVKAEKKEEPHPTAENKVKDSASQSPVLPAISAKKSEKDHRTEPRCAEPMETNRDTKEAKVPDVKPKRKMENVSRTKATTSCSPRSSSPTCPSSSCPVPSSSMVPDQDEGIKDEEKVVELKGELKESMKEKETVGKEELKKVSKVEKMDVDLKVETKTEKNKPRQSAQASRPSSTPPSDTASQEKSSTSGLKRTLSEGDEKNKPNIERDVKRPKVEGMALEAQLELKITAKAGSRLKVEKIVQQLMEDRLRVLQFTVFDKSLQELKDRVEKIDCATKHQTTIKTLQAKMARLTKKFGEANQISENTRKQDALVTAAAAAAAAASTKTAAAASTKTATAANTPQSQRPVRTSMEIKQTPATLVSTSGTVIPPIAHPTTVPTSTALVSQTPILQLITSTSNAAPTLATGITTQSPTGTLLLKTASGSSMVAQGQPLLIQLPLSMANGQTGTLVNIPVSSFPAANSLNKAKTTTPSTTFILKPAPSNTTPAASMPATTTVPALQTSSGQNPPTQISLARAVYQGGSGGIGTPNAGVSVTTARTPAHSVSVAGAMASTSSPAASGPAATGSTAPVPPQGTSMTSKTDNQATGSNPSKTTAQVTRPKGAIIDLTDDDDDVQVMGVKNASTATPSATQRPQPVVSVTNSLGARSSPQSNQNSANNPQLTVHHRPSVDSSVKSRAGPPTTPTRAATTALPPLPAAPPAPVRLSPEAAQTSPPQQPQLKLVPSQTGIVLSWCVVETDRSCAAVDSYHLYAFHQDNSNSNPTAQQHWKKIGEVKALPLPMACTLTQFQSGSTYHFAVRAKDIYGRFGSFCEPQCTNVINSTSS
ncbi:activating transcription factor 7-interacting protein 1 isoform X2 [Lampris incognitus]|nr:activating transcription factor 7-interacting protein 1 isoform X2 [Lampris incognitus]